MIKQMRQQGAYIVDIATQVGCSERTVRRYLKYPEPPARKTRHKMVKLKPFMDYIDMRLAENVWNSEVILAEIRTMGYTGGRSMLRYYIQPKRKMRPSKKTVRFETQPGYQLQHDWGEVEVDVAGQRCKVNFASSGRRLRSASLSNKRICSRCRQPTSIPATSISGMCHGMATSRLAATATVCPSRCVAIRSRSGSRWMTSCGSTATKIWPRPTGSAGLHRAGRQCRSTMLRCGNRSVR